MQENCRQSPICDSSNVINPLLPAKKEESVQYFLKFDMFEILVLLCFFFTLCLSRSQDFPVLAGARAPPHSPCASLWVCQTLGSSALGYGFSRETRHCHATGWSGTNSILNTGLYTAPHNKMMTATKAKDWVKDRSWASDKDGCLK